MQKKNRIFVIALMVLLASITLASIGSLLLGSVHECIGDGCAVCAGVSFCRALSDFIFVTAIVSIFSARFFAVSFKVIRKAMLSCVTYTLYTLGVSLLN